ncbi:MAG: AMMECR1 domain-containing protein [Pyrobaculum sp.]
MLGRVLISHIRSAMYNRLRGYGVVEDHPELSNMRSGLFITIETIVRSGGYEKREVRGSLGLVEPVKNLAYDSARIAAKLVSSIPRFTEFDLRRSMVEATLVGELRPWDGSLSEVMWGRDGVLVVSGDRKFVVLPQTMVERRLVGEVLLRYIESMSGGVVDKLYIFSTTIFYELRPDGEVIERELWKSRVFRQYLEVMR